MRLQVLCAIGVGSDGGTIDHLNPAADGKSTTTSTSNSLVGLSSIIQASNEFAKGVFTKLRYICQPKPSQEEQRRI